VVYSAESPLRSLSLLRALRNNEIVALQFDGHPLAPGGTAVEFFGRPAGFHLGPFLLARAAGASVLPVFIVRSGRRRYQIRLLGRYQPRTAADASDALRQVVAGFESLVRAHPHQWFQFADYWALGASHPAFRPLAARDTPRASPDSGAEERREAVPG
jgi:lauroyl/myristoyl acyltransferase